MEKTHTQPVEAPMIVKTYRVNEREAKDAEVAAKQIYNIELSVAVREFVKKLAKKKR